MKHLLIRDVVCTALHCHPRDCVFDPNALDNIMAKFAQRYGSDSVHPYDLGILDFLAEAIQFEEIYCPHEGIDRRDAYYAGINLAGWNDWSAIAHEMI